MYRPVHIARSRRRPLSTTNACPIDSKYTGRSDGIQRRLLAARRRREAVRGVERRHIVRVVLLRRLQLSQDAEREEDEACHDGRGADDGNHPDQVRPDGLDPRAGPAGAVVAEVASPTRRAVELVRVHVPIEERARHEAPEPWDSVHRKDISGIVEAQPPQHKRGAQIQHSSDRADAQRGPMGHGAAACGDGHEAGQDAIAHAEEVARPAPAEGEPKPERRETAGCRRQRGVHGNLRGQQRIADAGHGLRHATMEAVPPEPCDESAEDDERHTVRHEFVRRGPTAWAGRAEDRTDQGDTAAAQVDHAAAREVDHADCVHLLQHAPAPCASHYEGVDHTRHRQRHERICDVAHALRGARAHDRRGHAENGPVEEPARGRLRWLDEPLDWHGVEVHGDEALSAYEIGLVHLPAGGAERAAEGERPAADEPAEGPHAEVDEVLRQDVLGAPRAAEADLDHCEAGLHEHHEHATEEHPRQRQRGLDALGVRVGPRARHCCAVHARHRGLQAPIARLRLAARLQGGEALLLPVDEALLLAKQRL
mmetsp:Transcript_67171/g.188020  ORF Transcript_67171/g.188020 Transcript_67171/m.188020 type:complete len:539 (+) Transcript_67171:203-1819(+)